MTNFEFMTKSKENALTCLRKVAVCNLGVCNLCTFCHDEKCLYGDCTEGQKAFLDQECDENWWAQL